MTDGHEVPLAQHLTHDPSRAILEQVESGGRVSQRSLARDAGIAVGLANLLIHRMVAAGWIRMVRVTATRVTYEITPSGMAEKARRARTELAGGIHAYAEARERIAELLARLSAEWPAGHSQKRIAFFGSGDVAEIGYVCLQRTDLQLVAVIDDCSGRHFFGLPVSPITALSPGRVGEQPFDVLVVMYFGNDRDIGRRLSARGCPASSVFWI